MEHLAVQRATPAGDAFPARPISPSGDPRDTSFAAAIETATSPSAETARSAERLIGTQVRAPEGGCACDALAASASASPEPVRVDRGATIEPGDLLELSEPGNFGRSHLAVARTAREMIAVQSDGVVRVSPIPIERLLGLLRQPSDVQR